MLPGTELMRGWRTRGMRSVEVQHTSLTPAPATGTAPALTRLTPQAAPAAMVTPAGLEDQDTEILLQITLPK